MNHSSTAIWDEEHVKALLGLRRYPSHLIYTEPWHTWLNERGGEKQVMEHLRSSELPPIPKQLLDLLLTHPGISTLSYASKLHVSHSRYFFHLNMLVKLLVIELNGWKLEQQRDFITTPLSANLPAPLTSLVGVDKSLKTVATMLKRPTIRLLTLTGSGGVGKTRLAIAAAMQLRNKFRDGVFFVPLEAVTDPAFLPPQIAHFLNIKTDGTQSLDGVLKNCLRDRQILLILDNFEQIIPGRVLVTELLEAAAGLKILITSREALNVYGEHRFNVPELLSPASGPLPPLEQLSQFPAIDLFVQRAQARYPSFVLTDSNMEIIAGICNRLDGLPLAIELAATQVKLFDSSEALPRLERGLKSLRDLSPDRPKHHKTLWDAFDWSYQLLPTSEQALFRRLAVFGREWNMDAAQVVCETPDVDEQLEKLANKSLIRFTSMGIDGELRCQMLQALREYALERLANSGETEQTQRRHANYYLGLVLEAETYIGTPNQVYWMRRIEQERENLRNALQWMLNQNEIEMAFRMLGAVWRYFNMLNFWEETEDWMNRALAQDALQQTDGRSKKMARARTLWGAYWVTMRQNDHAKSWALAHDGLRLARELGDRRLIGLLLQCMIGELRYSNMYDEALQAVEESQLIFQELGDQQELAWVLSHRSALFSQRGDLVNAREFLEQSISIFRAIGNDWALGQVLRNLAILLLPQNDPEPIKAALEESLMLSEKLGDRVGFGWTRNLQGRLALCQSDLEMARKHFNEAGIVFEKLGDQHSLSFNRECLEQLE